MIDVLISDFNISIYRYKGSPHIYPTTLHLTEIIQLPKHITKLSRWQSLYLMPEICQRTVLSTFVLSTHGHMQEPYINGLLPRLQSSDHRSNQEKDLNNSELVFAFLCHRKQSNFPKETTDSNRHELSKGKSDTARYVTPLSKGCVTCIECYNNLNLS